MRRVFWSVLAFAVTSLGVWCATSVPTSLAANGRVFEQVSPAYKGGFGASFVEAISQSGESVAFYSPTAFAGAPAGLSQNVDAFDYIARRGPDGWVSVPAMPPYTVLPAVAGGGSGPGNRDTTPDLTTTLALGQVGPSNEAAEKEGTEAKFVLHDTELPDADAYWTIAGSPLTLLNHSAPIFFRYLGSSSSFCRLFFDEGQLNTIRNGPEVPLQEAENANEQVYEQTRGCGGEAPALRLVAVDNSGALISPLCRADIGIEHFAGINKEIKSAFNAIADNGEQAFFTTCIANEESDHQLFMRLAGAHTVEVSKPMSESCGEEIPCKEAAKRASADFAGASEDGSKVFFTTQARLTGEDADNGNDLYLAEIGCPSGNACSVAERRVTNLTQVSHDPNGGQADVRGVVRTAPDGSRAYFVAQGDLLSAVERQGLAEEGRPTPAVGADNLYMYDAAAGQVKFIAELCSGHAVSGSVEDSRCPSFGGTDTELWQLLNGDSSLAQTAGGDGRYLVFVSYGQLTSDDTDAAADVYRFDAVSGSLQRVSLGEDGYDSNGNNSEFDSVIEAGHYGGTVLRQYEMNNRAISEDGSRIVFTTAEPLSIAATNHLVNVYEWHEGSGAGEVSLLSGGNGPTSIADVAMAPSGRDVFFVTTQGLVPQDVDGQPDVYDARLGGGFAPQPAAVEPCAGDACQGPLTNPAPLLVPGSVSQPAEELIATPKKAAPPRKTKKKKRKQAIKHKGKKKKRKGKAAARNSRSGTHRGTRGGR